MKKLIIPNRFLNVDYDRDVLQSIKDYVDKFKETRKGLFLFGPAGTGKTYTAYAICKKIEESGIQVMAIKAIDILQTIKKEINSDNETSFLDELNDFKGLLFIDDLGTEKGTEWVLETFYSILDKKYEEMIPVIITSNCNLNELGEKMGDRFSSRIAQMCEVIAMVGEDRRLK